MAASLSWTSRGSRTPTSVMRARFTLRTPSSRSAQQSAARASTRGTRMLTRRCPPTRQSRTVATVRHARRRRQQSRMPTSGCLAPTCGPHTVSDERRVGAGAARESLSLPSYSPSLDYYGARAGKGSTLFTWAYARDMHRLGGGENTCTPLCLAAATALHPA